MGRFLLVSPAAHSVHHAADPRCFDRNFGVLLPWWDHWFGTWRAPEPGEQPIGVPGDDLVECGWARGVWACYRDFLNALVKVPMVGRSRSFFVDHASLRSN